MVVVVASVPVITTTQLNIQLRKNADFILALTMKNGGVPIDITGWNAIMRLQQVGGNSGRDFPPIDISIENGRVYNGGETGEFIFTVPGSVSMTIPWVNGEYNVIVRDTSGKAPEVIYGTATALNAIAPLPSILRG